MVGVDEQYHHWQWPFFVARNGVPAQDYTSFTRHVNQLRPSSVQTAMVRGHWIFGAMLSRSGVLLRAKHLGRFWRRADSLCSSSPLGTLAAPLRNTALRGTTSVRRSTTGLRNELHGEPTKEIARLGWTHSTFGKRDTHHIGIFLLFGLLPVTLCTQCHYLALVHLLSSYIDQLPLQCISMSPTLSHFCVCGFASASTEVT